LYLSSYLDHSLKKTENMIVNYNEMKKARIYFQ